MDSKWALVVSKQKLQISKSHRSRNCRVSVAEAVKEE